jgi:hypothetical protein
VSRLGICKAVGEHECANATVKARAAAHVVEQQLPIQSTGGQSRTHVGVRGAELSGQPCAVSERRANQRRVGGLVIVQRRDAVCALGMTFGDHDQHLQRGHLEREADLGAVGVGELALEQVGELVVTGVENEPRR